MLIRESDIALFRDNDFESILSEAVYLDEKESKINPRYISVVENSRLGVSVVSFDDIKQLSENHGITYKDAIKAVAEANKVDKSKLVVAVDEAEIIGNPNLPCFLENVVIKPISSNDPISKAVDFLIQESVAKEDENILENGVIYIANESGINGDEDGIINKLNTGLADPEEVIKALSATSKLAKQHIKTIKPNIIHRIIAKLRIWAGKIRAKYENSENKSIWLKIKNKIAKLIEWLGSKLQSDEKLSRATEYENIKNAKNIADNSIGFAQINKEELNKSLEF